VVSKSGDVLPHRPPLQSWGCNRDGGVPFWPVVRLAGVVVVRMVRTSMLAILEKDVVEDSHRR
jgi:hypothetical protein